MRLRGGIKLSSAEIKGLMRESLGAGGPMPPGCAQSSRSSAADLSSAGSTAT